VSGRTADPRAVLLDTCAAIWLANGEPLHDSAVAVIIDAGLADGILVSPISAWEVGLLSRSRRGRRVGVEFLPDPKTWFARLMSFPGIKPAPLSPAVAIDASYLPGELHGESGDRLMVATARDLGVPIVTRDRKIMAYARDGHVRVIPC
jgi:PIN domain nuclease of toxin-antitoxin system